MWTQQLKRHIPAQYNGLYFICPTLTEKKIRQYFPFHPSQPRKEHIAKMVHQHARLIIPLKFCKRKYALYEDLEQDLNDLNLFSL